MDAMNLASEKYHYTCGGGSHFNRYIVFKRPLDDNPSRVIAEVYTYSPTDTKDQLISHLNGHQIKVDMMSTTEKMQALMAERRGEVVINKPIKRLADLSLNEQNEIFSKLGTKWRVEIINTIGPRTGARSFEKVEELNLFKPG